MTYRELITKANAMLDSGEINLGEWYEMTEPTNREIELDTDTISRQQAIDTLFEILDRPKHAEFLYADEIYKVLSNLPPSPTPSRPKGHWKFIHPLQEDDPGAYVCSECDNGDWCINPIEDKFCKFCGADMRQREYITSLETPCDDCDFADRCTYESNCPREAIWEAEHKMEE